MSLAKPAEKAISDAISQSTPAIIQGNKIDVAFDSQILNYQNNRLVLKNAVSPELISDFMKSDSYSLQIGMIRFSSKQISTDGKNILFDVDDEKIISDSRSEKRLMFGKYEDAYCTIENPLDPNTELRFQLLEASDSGFSFMSRYNSLLFIPGLKISKIKISKSKDGKQQGYGEVVYKRKLMNDSFQLRFQIGIRFSSK